MAVDQLMGELSESVNDVLDSTKSVKGEAYANTVAGLFELMQAQSVASATQVHAAEVGVDISLGITEVIRAVSMVASRLTYGMTDEQASAAMKAAKLLLDRRARAVMAAHREILQANPGAQG